MIQEIEKILTFRLDIRQSDFSLGNDKLAAEEIYKLFLSKQMELLNEIRPFIGIEGLNKINEKLSELQSELKQLES